MMNGMGAMMVVWWILGFVLLAAAVAAGVWVGRSLPTKNPGPHGAAARSELETARRRYAAGEIDREEYLQIEADLER